MTDPTNETITAYIRPPYLTLDADDAARIAYRRMEGDNVRSLVVVTKDQKYVGIVEWRSIRHLTSVELTEPAAKFANQTIPTLSADMSIAEAMAAFQETDVAALGLLPVLEANGRLEGVVEREEFQGLMQSESGEITVREDPVAHLLTGPNVPQHGAKVVSSDGRKLGTFLQQVEDRGRARWIEVEHGHLWRKRTRYVPLVAIDRQSPTNIVLNIDGRTWSTFEDRPK